MKTNAVQSRTGIGVNVEDVILQGGAINPCTCSGSNPTYVLTLAQTQALTYQGLMVFSFTAGFTNTGACNAQVGAQAAKPIVTQDGQALSGGEIQNGSTYFLMYDTLSSGRFKLMNPSKTPLLSVPWSQLGGLGMSTVGSSTTLTIAAGGATDSTNVQSIRFAGLNKVVQAAGNWAAGNNGNGLPGSLAGGGAFGGAVANTWYEVFLLGKLSDPTASDIGIDSSLTAANLLANQSGNPGAAGWNLARRIGAIYTDVSKNIKLFFQDGDYFWWGSPLSNSVTTIANSGTGTLRSLASQTNGDVPSGLAVIALLYVQAQATAGVGVGAYVWDPALGSTRPAVPTIFSGATGTTTLANVGAKAQVRVDISQRVYDACDAAITTFQIGVDGWIDFRGKDL